MPRLHSASTHSSDNARMKQTSTSIPACPIITGALTTRLADFWLLGGASILVWVCMMLGQHFRTKSWVIDHQFQNLAGLFAALSLFVNYPHFMISYKFAYNRGPGFIVKHWFCLLAVPIFLIAVYTFGYFEFEKIFDETQTVTALNAFFNTAGLGIHIGAPNVGVAVQGFAIWLMFLTVGWHYAKQVFGCMLVYARYDRYPVSRFQKTLLKVNLLGLAWLNYFFNTLTVNGYLKTFSKYISSPQFLAFDISHVFVSSLEWVCYGLTLATCYFVFFRNYKTHRRLPSANMSVAWLAYLVWSLPILRQEEFFLMVIPFFHSLQYLPFAYKLESAAMNRSGDKSSWRISAAILGWIIVGFLAFELIPNTLDNILKPDGGYRQSWYFFTCALTFINIHHFFMDSVTWRFKSPEVQQNLLGV